MLIANLLLVLMHCSDQVPQNLVAQAFNDLDHWQLEQATDLAGHLLSESPNDKRVQLLNAEVLHQQGRHQTALALWRSAQGTYPERSHAIGPRIWASAAYAPYFKQHTSQHFDIHYMDKDIVIAALAAEVLELAYQRFGKILNFYPAEGDQKIVVEIYPDTQGLAGATGLTFREIQTSGTIAVCKFHRLMVLSPLATLRGYAWADTLAHEFAHLVISKKSKNTIPVWLHEGIAKYLETQWRLEKPATIAAYQQNLLAEALQKNTLVTLQRMHPSMAKLASQDEAALAFTEVFTLVRYLHDTFGLSVFSRLLDVSAKTNALDLALKQVLGIDLPTLEKRWLKSLQSQHFSRVPNARKPRLELASEQENPASTANASNAIDDKQVHDRARLGELLQLRAHTPAAIVEYEKAIEKDADQYPEIRNQLARLYMQQNREDKALKLAESVLKTDPDNSAAELIEARIYLHQGQLEKAKVHYESLLFQNPFQPEVHQALERIYTDTHRPDKAKEQAFFTTICEQTRPKHDIVVPRSDKPDVCPKDHGLLRLMACRQMFLQIDTMPSLPTPVWDLCLPAGTHQYRVADTNLSANTFELAPQTTKTIISAKCKDDQKHIAHDKAASGPKID